MKKILTHICQQRTYLPLLQELYNHFSIVSGNLHESIFDAYHKTKPDVVFLPIYEYTQEFHEFVDRFHKTTSIVIFLAEIEHRELIAYCTQNNIKLIRQNTDNTTNTLGYKYLYDSTVFVHNEQKRNDKILTVLSDNNDINTKYLYDILYPKTHTKIVAINNPEFKHPQNIGVANSIDMATLFNQYGSLIDLTGSYKIEAQACQINNLKLGDDMLSYIEKEILIEKEPNIEQYEIKNFVTQKLVPFIGA